MQLCLPYLPQPLIKPTTLDKPHHQLKAAISLPLQLQIWFFGRWQVQRQMTKDPEALQIQLWPSQLIYQTSKMFQFRESCLIDITSLFKPLFWKLLSSYSPYTAHRHLEALTQYLILSHYFPHIIHIFEHATNVLTYSPITNKTISTHWSQLSESKINNHIPQILIPDPSPCSLTASHNLMQFAIQQLHYTIFRVLQEIQIHSVDLFK